MAGDDQTLGEILGVDEASHSTWQELVGGILLDAAAQKPEAALAPVQITVSDPLAWVDEQIRAATGRQVGNRPVWVRFFRPAQDIGALFVLSAPHPVDGADLVMVANRGMITRGLIRDLCRWAFYATGLSRVVVRIPVERADLQDYARRAGLANGLTTQGGASQSYGNALSALGTGQGNMQASILGQGAALQQGLGNQFNALINNSTGALVSNNNALAASQTKASENALGAIVGLGKAVLDFNPFKGL